MNETGFFFADQNGPFLVAMVVTLAIAAIEVLSLVLGLGLSDMIDDILPDFDADTPEIESSLIGEALGWLNVGRVPFLVLLLAFLGFFTVGGYALQLFLSGSLGFLLPSFIAAPLALVAALPATRIISRGLARILPRDETYATGEDELVGRLAVVTLGPVTRRTPGKAKVTDAHGNTHFVRVRAAQRGKRFQPDETVLLVGHRRSLFDAITPPSSLSD
jgi:Inner membrane protein YqiJ, N-terminal/Inner membrane protein YqiJ, OB-fold